MNPTPHRAAAPPQPSPEHSVAPDSPAESNFEGLDPLNWEEPHTAPAPQGAGGRAVLGSGLIVLALLWMGYTAWTAGRALAGEPLSSPAIAQWVAVAAGPLALLGLAWIMFGRTRRREAERFTRSVIEMRHEATALEALLGVLSTRINDSNSDLSHMATQLMSLGDEATGRMGAASRDLSTSTQLIVRHGEAFDRVAETARTDIAVLLDDLPRAEATARAMAEQLRGTGAESLSRAAALEQQVGTLTERTREADEMVAAAAQRLVTHLTHIESAGAAAAARVGEAEAGFSVAIDTLLDRTARMLDEVRSGIDTQSAAVLALVEQSSAGLGRAGIEAADALGSSISGASGAVDGLSARVAEQERAAQHMLAEIDRGLALIDQRFAELARNGDERAEHFLGSLTRARAELDLLAQQAGSQDGALEGLASRTDALRAGIERLSADINDGLTAAINESEAGAARLVALTGQARPEVEWMRDASDEAATRIADSAAGIAEQQDRFASLLATLDDGVGSAETRLGQLTAALGQAQGEAARLTGETGPALVAAMVQVREAAGHAAERAREALAGVVPEAAGNLSEAARTALETVIRESIEERLREVETTAARAVDAARAASDRLTQQMLTLGQSAAALEQHIEQTEATSREKDSEAFTRRVSLLMDAMHSAAIDVGKILSDEIDEKTWDSYLKGNRGVFTRRAVRLLDGAETKAIRVYYEADAEFQQSVNRYVQDFESMLRRVLAERDSGIIAVTLMSSDMGKLYAALAQVVERRRYPRVSTGL